MLMRKTSTQCLVKLFLKYNSLCPSDHPDHALYFTILKNPTSECWFSRVPVWHNALSDPNVMRKARIEGYRTQNCQLSVCIKKRTWKALWTNLNKNQKKTKVESVKGEGSENVQPSELANQTYCGMQSLPTMLWSFDGPISLTLI